MPSRGLGDVYKRQEAPVTLIDSHLGPQVKLNGGSFEECVFLRGAAMGSGAHVRQGTIFEEYASGAHSVGVKQTILFPYVTLGSLINFCDCLMAGGTGPKNHSEVGSSYIHFNFTPHQDKATASMLGDVARGVMLDQAPIFLGGQGGLVGPCRINYGNVIAAGSIYRKDALGSGKILIASPGRGGSLPFRPGVHINVKRIFVNNVIYLANLVALKGWYHRVRSQFVSGHMAEMLHEGLCTTLNGAISERLYRLEQWGGKIERAAYENPGTVEGLHGDLIDRLEAVTDQLNRDSVENQGDLHQRDVFLEIFKEHMHLHDRDYMTVISKLPPAAQVEGTAWLKSIVSKVVKNVFEMLPAMHGNDIERLI